MDHDQRQEARGPHQAPRHPVLARLDDDDDLNGQSLDYEPNLEFDDTDLKQDIEEELGQLEARALLELTAGAPQCPAAPARTAYLESPHDLLDESFEEALEAGPFERQPERRANRLDAFLRQAAGGLRARAQPLADSLAELRLDETPGDDFADIAQHNCVEVAGDDLFGRRIITIYACRLPSANKIHHSRLLRYIMHTLDQYVENDYCLVYFHYGLNSHNKPKLNFLYQAYKAFDRKYKKNLKALFLVHPTNFIRVVWQLFRPIIR